MKKFYRSSFLHFVDRKHVYFEDGILVTDNGFVVELEQSSEVLKRYSLEITPETLTHYPNRLIIPGMVDLHTHYPQMEMIASHGEELLDWLNRYTFPTEQKYHAPAYAQSVSKRFLRELLKNGTTTALVFPTVHKESVSSLFEEASALNMRIISGKVLMDRNAPENLRDSAQTGYSDSIELIHQWHNKKRLQYAVTPRFAPTSTIEQLQMAGNLRREFPDVFVQTHLSENKKEIDWVKSLFSDYESYLDVYAKNNLIGPKTIFAHCIHLDDNDFKLLAETGSAIAFCPSSNLFLGSGLFKMAQANAHGVKVGLGTDVGAGTSLSMLATMHDAYKVIQMHRACSPELPAEHQALTSLNAFYLATLGGAKALGLDDKIGNFEPGKEADFVVFNAQKGSSQLQWRSEETKSLEEQLFAIQMLGDDRVIEATYLMSELVSSETYPCD